MKLFKASDGTIISFGFDMLRREENAYVVSWNDPDDGSWECTEMSIAGWIAFKSPIAPQFVRESSSGHIVAFQPGLCLEMKRVGGPMVWEFTLLTPDHG